MLGSTGLIFVDREEVNLKWKYGMDHYILIKVWDEL